MSEFVKKTALGYRPASGGHSDPECSHVILTKEEYDRMLQEKAQAVQEKRNTAYIKPKKPSKERKTLRSSKSGKPRKRLVRALIALNKN